MKRIANYREYLSRPIAQLFLRDIVNSVGAYPADFEIIYALITDNEKNIAWKAAWACQKVFNKYPDFLKGKQNELVDIILKNNHCGTRRILLAILLELPVPEPFPVDLLDFCFFRMLNPDEATAVQALCIKIAYKLCLCEPELLPELKLYLENADPEYYSSGARSCIRNVLKKID